MLATAAKPSTIWSSALCFLTSTSWMFGGKGVGNKAVDKAGDEAGDQAGVEAGACQHAYMTACAVYPGGSS